MNEGTRSGKSTIRLLGISAERPTNVLYLTVENITVLIRTVTFNISWCNTYVCSNKFHVTGQLLADPLAKQ
jgi:hypothetical protein